ncbi:hypothetical protein [Haloarcula salina]|uniref:DUF7847 domain-containing protein n=1 Tax=Haloarcula salina TaxID=1429914 RepID=A0AA41KL47_9EURY|nr:hypothetical protein [Haloarcula salina]MBV0902514.1 hypothetical protein [Haloarcula salina]
MALQIGSALSEAGHRLVSRTGAILLGAFFALMLGFQSMLNTMVAVVLTDMGFGEVRAALPLVLDLPLSVAGAGVALGTILSAYLSIVAFRTFIAGARDSFPDDAFTRNIPLAMVNLAVGGFVYSLLVFVGSLLLLVPGIFAYVVFIFMAPYIIDEDRNFVSALKASYRLTEGERLPLFGLLVIVVAAAGLVGGVVGFVGGFALSAASSQLLNVVIQVPVSLYVTAVMAVAFQQLRDADGSSPSSPSGVETPSTTV